MKFIKLATERYWVESGNFELWPEILSCLPAEMTTLNVKQMAQQYLSKDLFDSAGNPGKSREIFGLMGLAVPHKGYPEIRGVNCIAINKSGMVLTSAALELVEAYRSKGAWELLLARQLLRYSPRCRVIIYLLGQGGYLVVTGKLPQKLSRAELHYNERVFYPFHNQPQKNDMNYLLQDFHQEALGPYWLQDLKDAGISLDEDWQFTGILDQHPSCTNMSTMMRPVFTLLLYLEWLIPAEDGIYRLNFARLTADLADEELFTTVTNESLSVYAWLQKLIDEQQDRRGFVVTETVMQDLQRQCFPDWDTGMERFIDYFITQGVNEGKLQILAHESGQPRHGRGYLGKREYQLLKLNVRG